MKFNYKIIILLEDNKKQIGNLELDIASPIELNIDNADDFLIELAKTIVIISKHKSIKH